MTYIALVSLEGLDNVNGTAYLNNKTESRLVDAVSVEEAKAKVFAHYAKAEVRQRYDWANLKVTDCVVSDTIS